MRNYLKSIPSRMNCFILSIETKANDGDLAPLKPLFPTGMPMTLVGINASYWTAWLLNYCSNTNPYPGHLIYEHAEAEIPHRYMFPELSEVLQLYVPDIIKYFDITSLMGCDVGLTFFYWIIIGYIITQILIVFVYLLFGRIRAYQFMFSIFFSIALLCIGLVFWKL